MSGLFDPPDRGLFLRSEKDTRPFWETDQRGMFWPIMRSGYNNARSWAVPEALGGHGLRVMHDIVQGNPLTVDEINHGAQGASNFMLVGGLAGNVGSKPQPGVAAMFAGPRAKTADMGAHNRASLMDSAGMPREQIWKDTGWFKGVDGKWRHEIDDSGTKLTEKFIDEPSGSGLYLQQSMPHPELAAAYPDSSNLFVMKQGREGGAYNAPIQQINVGARTAEDGRSTLLHEVQHAVQGTEGFARGGNPAEFEKWYKVPLTRDLHISPNQRQAFDKYRALAGEVEARTVESRRNLSDIERRARPPWLDYDVPEAQQIVRFGNEGQQMSMSGAQPPKGVPLIPEGVFPNQTGMIGAMRRAGVKPRGPSYEADVPVGSIRPLQPPNDLQPEIIGRMMENFPPRDVNTSKDQGVWLYKNGEDYYTMDGHHRAEAARRLGHETIPARVTDVFSNPKQGATMSLAENAAKRAVDPLGYYSQLDEVLKQFKPTDTVTAQTLMQRGVKQAELDARGLGKAFDNGGVRVGDLKPGKALRNHLSKGDKEAAAALREAGIPGIRYLDQGSRAVGEGSSNYVVFDDKLIEILRKYGLLGGMVAGASAANSGDASASERRGLFD